MNSISTRPAVARSWIVIAVMSSTIMEIIDTSVVNVSLPHIAGSLSASIPDATWAITSYIVANAVILPMTGWLSNFFGRKRLLMTVVTGFTVSSALCAFAPSLPFLVLCRVLQGITGGGLQPLSQAVLLEEFPPAERGRAMAIWGLGIVAAPILGPTLGGWLTDSFSWRWVFLINLPIGILSWTLIKTFINDPPHIKRGSLKVDGWGIGMLALGMGALQIMLDKGQDEDWFGSRLIISLAVIAGIMLPAFVFRELYTEHPLVQFRLLKERNFACGIIVATVMSFVLYGSLISLPLFMQTILGWPTLTAGIWMSPRGIGSMVGMFLMMKGARWFRKLDARQFIACGFGITAIIFFIYARMNANSGIPNLVVPQFFQGLAMSLAFVPLTTLTMAFVKLEKIPYATSLYSTLRNIGSSMGISFVATYVERRKQFHHARLSEHMYASNPAIQQQLAGLTHHFQTQGSDVHTAGAQAIGELYRILLGQVNVLSYIDVFRVLGVLFLVIIPLAFLMRQPPISEKKPAAIN